MHYGLVASGNHVLKNFIARDKLNWDLGGDVLCAEIEAAGRMDRFPYIIFPRGLATTLICIRFEISRVCGYSGSICTGTSAIYTYRRAMLAGRKQWKT